MKTLILLFAIFSSSFCFSQNLEYYKTQYPKDDVITLSLNNHIDITESNGSLSIKETVVKKDYYLTNQKLSHANESVSFNTFNSIESIDAFTENEDSKNNVSNFENLDVIRNGIFFADQKKKIFSFPNVKEGSTTTLKYEKSISDPHFLPSFIISDTTPIETAELSVSFPNNVDVAYTTFNLEAIDSNFEIIKDKNKTTYKWTLNSVPKINSNYDFHPLYYIPQVFVYIKSYTNEGSVHPILSDTAG